MATGSLSCSLWHVFGVTAMWGLILVNFMYSNIFKDVGPGYLSLYSDSLRAGRSGDRIPVGVRFSAAAQTVPGVHPASYTTGTRYNFPGVKQPGSGVAHPPHLAPKL